MNTNNTENNQEVLEYVTTKRNKKMLLRAGYRYTKKRENISGNVVWTCTSRNECSATVTVASETVIHETPHHCAQNYEKNEVKKKLEECKERAISEGTPLPKIFS